MNTYIITAVTHCTYVLEAETPEDAVWTFASNDPMAVTETFTVYDDYGNEIFQEVTNDNRRV